MPRLRWSIVTPQDAAATPDPAAEPGPETPICSAKGCRRPAAYALKWNNPKIHDADRRKIWLACDEHRDSLADFLDRRSFLRDVTSL
jgi:predicted Fe-S protein YdhL (DUF1289 family)